MPVPRSRAFSTLWKGTGCKFPKWTFAARIGVTSWRPLESKSPFRYQIRITDDYSILGCLRGYPYFWEIPDLALKTLMTRDNSWHEQVLALVGAVHLSPGWENAASTASSNSSRCTHGLVFQSRSV